VVFVPQIAILFLFLAILEDSGYLARAAFLMDRVLSKVGLHGKSFIPLLSSFACAIPGIMATRTIENRKDRLATIFVAPFMSCSARLPVYGLLIGAFFGGYNAWVRGGIMFSMYVIGVLAAVVTAYFFKRTLLKGAPTSFILELPAYKIPQIGQVGRAVWTNTKAFLVKAGTIIFALSVILWAMSYYPRLPEATVASIEGGRDTMTITDAHRDHAAAELAEEALPDTTITEEQIVDKAKDIAVSEKVNGLQLEKSIAGKFGHAIEPVIKPLGYDWKMGVGLVGAFAAREVFVSSMGIVYSVGGDDENTTPLEDQMKADVYPNGDRVWTPLVAVSLLVWFVLAMQCMSTLAIVKRETGGWLWPLAMLVYMNGLAWVVCFGIYQIGRIWFA
jgi:ferrous iron transport protein B